MEVETESVEIDIEALQPNPLQPRGQILPDSLVELAESIREHGVLEPIIVARTPAGYQIIAGERRWRAAKLAGNSKIAAVIKETSTQGMLEMSIVENVQRVDLNPLERAQAYKKLMEEFNLSTAEIGQRVAKSGPYISNTMRLLDLPDALKDGLLTNAITEGHAKAILGLDNSNLIMQAYKRVLQDNLGVRSTEEMVRRMKAGAQVKPRTSRTYEHTPDIDKMEKEISESTKVKVKLLKSSKGGRLLLIFKTEEELLNIHKKLTS